MGKDRSTCWLCRHFYFDGGSPGYSDLTPGSNASFECDKGVWEIDLYQESEITMHEKLSTSQRCLYFEGREE